MAPRRRFVALGLLLSGTMFLAILVIDPYTDFFWYCVFMCVWGLFAVQSFPLACSRSLVARDTSMT